MRIRTGVASSACYSIAIFIDWVDDMALVIIRVQLSILSISVSTYRMPNK